MAYPTDTGVTYTAKTNNIDTINDSDVNNLQTEIGAVKTLLGVIGSVVSGTFYYLMSEITGSDKAVGKTATQTLTNKTLTSPVVNVGSDASGDMYYRNAGVLTRIPVGTDNQIMKLNGTTPNWEAETSTVDASTTVKGVVEAATSAEITAGTATGGTGAVLVVTPDALAASTPVFNGSSLTNLPTDKITTAIPVVDVGTSSTAENTLLSYSLAGGVIGSSNIIKITGYLFIYNAGGSATTTLRFKFGSTTYYSPTFALSGGVANYVHKFEWLICGSGATSTQNSDIILHHTSTNNPAYVTESTSTEDTTTSKTIAITAQHSVSDSNYHATIKNVAITKIY